MIDTVPAVALYDDPPVALLVDKRAFYHRTAPFAEVLRERWYPKARVIGLYKTASGSRPYVDVVAILVRPVPDLRELFSL